MLMFSGEHYALFTGNEFELYSLIPRYSLFIYCYMKRVDMWFVGSFYYT